MTKQYSWVPVLEDDDSNIYVPAQYETRDIYQGKDCLPMYDTKEECEQWCLNKNFVNNTSNTDLENLMKEFDNYEVKESFENKSLKWWMNLSLEQQVEIGLKYNQPTFNLTIRDIMFEYEQSCRIKS